nr:GIY-YIG nuclease family protein [Patescibacteria group bacterium]
MSSWFVYLLRCEDATLYTGISTDVQARFEKHRCGQGAAYTRSHKPVAVVWTESAPSQSAA